MTGLLREGLTGPLRQCLAYRLRKALGTHRVLRMKPGRCIRKHTGDNCE
jgi:hypothetical protein